jgi:surface antigen
MFVSSVRSKVRSAVLLALVCGGAHAQSNLAFLKDSPVARFNDDDFRLLQEAGEATLKGEEVPATRSWRNAKTGHSGSVTATQRFTFETRDCRRLRVDSQAAGMRSTTQLSACRNDTGRWTIDTRARARTGR